MALTVTTSPSLTSDPQEIMVILASGFVAGIVGMAKSLRLKHVDITPAADILSFTFLSAMAGILVALLGLYFYGFDDRYAVISASAVAGYLGPWLWDFIAARIKAKTSSLPLSSSLAYRHQTPSGDPIPTPPMDQDPKDQP